jgi:hypothetical protein
MAKKRTTAKSAICEWIRENNITNQNDIIVRCKACMDKPNLQKLEDQYWNRTANSVTASVRDKNYIRIAFPIHGNKGVEVHNIEKTTDPNALSIIRKRYDLNIKGSVKSRAKIKMRQAELAGQLSLNFEKKDDKGKP